MKKLILFLLLLLLFTSPVFASTVYVDNGSSGCSTPTDTDYNPTTRVCGSGANTVYNTIQAAFDAVSSGDTILIKPGTYSEAPNTVVGNMTIRGDGTTSTIIIGSDGNSFIIDTNGNTLDGLTFWSKSYNSGGPQVKISSDSNTIENCILKGKHADGYGILFTDTADNNVIDNLDAQGGVVYYGSHTGSDNAATLTDSAKSWGINALVGLTVVNANDGLSFCVITANDANTATCTLVSGTENDWDTNDGYYISDSPIYVPIQIAGTYNTVQNSSFHDLSEVAAVFLVWGNYHTVKNSTVYNIYDVGGTSSVHTDVVQTWGNAAPWPAANYFTFENNTVYNGTCQIFNASNDSGGTAGYWMVRNNTFVGMTLTSNIGIPHFRLVNNTFINSHFNTYGIRFMCTAVNGTWDSSNAYVKNNVFIGCGTPDGNNDGYGWFGFEDEEVCTGNSASNNYVSKSAEYSTPYASKSGWNTDNGNINGGDPKFVSYATSDLRIGSDSPLRDTGADLSAIWSGATDKAGIARPQGAAWDIGAYEYYEPTPSNYMHGVTLFGVHIY